MPSRPATRQLTERQEAIRFLRTKLNIKKPDEYQIQGVVCGLHSGIPPCCVAYFMRVLWPLYGADDVLGAFTSDVEAMKAPGLTVMAISVKLICRSILDSDEGSNVGYRRCPACIVSDHRVKVKKCNCVGNSRDAG